MTTILVLVEKKNVRVMVFTCLWRLSEVSLSWCRLHQQNLAHHVHTCLFPRPDCLHFEIQYRFPSLVPAGQRVCGPPGRNLGPQRFTDSASDPRHRFCRYASYFIFFFFFSCDCSFVISRILCNKGVCYTSYASNECNGDAFRIYCILLCNF